MFALWTVTLLGKIQNCYPICSPCMENIQTVQHILFCFSVFESARIVLKSHLMMFTARLGQTLNYTGWTENKCHPVNSRRGKLKGPIYSIYRAYNMGSKIDSFLRKWRILISFIHVVLLISLETMRKHVQYISRFIFQGRNIIFKNILRVRYSSRKIK